MQDDILFPTFKCEQALLFAARLKLDKPLKFCKEKVEELISELGL